MQNITLADWAAWYDTCVQQSYRNAYKKADIDNIPVATENENNDDELLDNENSLTSVSPKKSIKKRSQARIIRSVWFNKDALTRKALS